MLIPPSRLRPILCLSLAGQHTLYNDQLLSTSRRAPSSGCTIALLPQSYLYFYCSTPPDQPGRMKARSLTRSSPINQQWNTSNRIYGAWNEEDLRGFESFADRCSFAAPVKCKWLFSKTNSTTDELPLRINVLLIIVVVFMRTLVLISWTFKNKRNRQHNDIHRLCY